MNEPIRWKKKGILWRPDKKNVWSQKFGILPTPFQIREDSIRIFFATTDADNIGRISFIDVDAANPCNILSDASDPILMEGAPGSFDDSGVNPSFIETYGSEIRLYYIGYQRSLKVPYLLFSGLALSTDGGKTFSRRNEVPFLDRRDCETSIRSAPVVVGTDMGRRIFYVSASGWQTGTSGKSWPTYSIRTILANDPDGLDWSGTSRICVSPNFVDGEIGLGRPWVIRENGMYRMWYSIRYLEPGENLVYRRIGYAESINAVEWTRLDDQFAFDRSADGWDSQMVCYPATIRSGDKLIMFYNGNGNGAEGFGYAEIELPISGRKI